MTTTVSATISAMRIVKAFFITNLKNFSAYRGAIIVWTITGIISVGIGLLIWLSAGNSVVGGYTRNEIVSYYVALFFFDHICGWFIFSGVRHNIQLGEINNFLVKPLSYIQAKVGDETSFKIVSLVIISIAGAILVPTLIGNGVHIQFYPDIRWLFLLLAIPGAIITSFLFNFCMGLLGFWFTETNYVNYLYWTVLPLLGGYFLPTSFLPQTLERLNWFLPFRYQLSLPLEILLNRLPLSQLLQSLLIMFIWNIILFKLYKIMWKKGLRSYSAFGH